MLICGDGDVQEGRENAVPMDIEIGGGIHDVLTGVGFSNTLFQIMNLKVGSGAFSAPVCSTWVFLFLVQIRQRLFCSAFFVVEQNKFSISHYLYL